MTSETPAKGCALDRELALRSVGDPIDVVTGAFIDHVRDFIVHGRAPLEWRRFYSTARAAMERGLGRGWTHSFDHQLRLDLDGTRYVAPNGTTIKFPFLGPELPRAAKRGYILTRDGDEFRLRRPDAPPLLFRRFDRAKLRLVAVGAHALLTTVGYSPDGRIASLGDPDGRTILVIWDQDRIVGARIVQRFGDVPKDLVRYRYDGDRLAEAEDAYHHTQRYEYDGDARVTRRIDRRGYSFFFRYDADGRCVHSAAEDGLLEVTLRYFPLEGRTIVTRGAGGDWQYFADPSGTLTKIIDPLGAVRTFVPRAEDGQIGLEIDGAGNELTYVYDANGKYQGTRDAEGRWVRSTARHTTPRTPLEWELGDLGGERFELPEPNVPIVGLPPAVATRLVAAVDATRGRTVQVRDVQGVLIREERDGRTRRYAYEPNGNLRWSIDFDGGKTDYEVASFNNRVAVTDPNGLVTRFEYTREDELAAVVDPGGGRCDFQRSVDRAVTVIARASAARELYTRDGAGRLRERRDGQGRLLYSLKRGPQGEVLERTFASGGFERLAYDGQLRVVKGETTAGVTGFACSDGKRVRDERDGRGVRRSFVGDDLIELRALDRFVTRYRYSDSPGRRTVVLTDPTGRVHRLSRIGDGILQRELSNGVRETAQYHPNGQCLRKIVHRDASPALWERAYEYSGEGDLLASRDSARGGARYAYDAGHRLVGEQVDGEAPRAFVHDAAGNLVQNGAGQATFWIGNVLASANGRTFTHDARQALAIDAGPAGERRFFRDERDQLVGVQDSSRSANGAMTPTLRWSAKYDVLGRRTEKTVGERTTVFYWDTDRLIAEILPSGALRVYVYADARAMTPLLFVDYASVDADPASGTVYVVFANHLGCPEAVQDLDGRWVWTARIEPYGRAHVEIGADFHQPMRWPGHYYDAELGLHYNRFRTYSPELGRYLEPDPLGRGGGLENVYQYTAGNPLRAVDLRGLNNCSQGNGPEDNKPAGEEEGRSDEEIARTEEPAEEGALLSNGDPMPPGTTKVTYSDGENEVVSYVDPEGRIIRVVAPLKPPANYTKQGVSDITPDGYVSGRDHRGHLAPERGAPNQDLVNQPENVIAEHGTQSNLSAKKRWENGVIGYANENPDSDFSTVHEPQYDGDNTRPSSVNHQLLQDGEPVPSYEKDIPNPQ